MSGSVHWANFAIAAVAISSAVGGGLVFGGRKFSEHLGRNVRTVASEVVASQLAVFKTAVDARFDTNDADSKLAADKATALEVELARQFGGNSNGIRQALDKQGQDLATLTGRFDEHTRRPEPDAKA